MLFSRSDVYGEKELLLIKNKHQNNGIVYVLECKLIYTFHFSGFGSIFPLSGLLYKNNISYVCLLGSPFFAKYWLFIMWIQEGYNCLYSK